MKHEDFEIDRDATAIESRSYGDLMDEINSLFEQIESEPNEDQSEQKQLLRDKIIDVEFWLHKNIYSPAD
jgi:hypothetical protein